MEDRILELCKKIIVSTEEEFLHVDCDDICCDDCPLSSVNNFDHMCCSDRDYNENIEIAENYLKENTISNNIKELRLEIMNYECISKSKEIGISKNGYGEYEIYYDISNKPKFFVAYLTLELAKEIADKLDEVYYLGR